MSQDGSLSAIKARSQGGEARKLAVDRFRKRRRQWRRVRMTSEEIVAAIREGRRYAPPIGALENDRSGRLAGPVAE